MDVVTTSAGTPSHLVARTWSKWYRHGTITVTALGLGGLNVVVASAATLGESSIVVAAAITSLLVAILGFSRVGSAVFLALMPLYALRYLPFAPMVSELTDPIPSTILLLRVWQALPDAITIMLTFLALFSEWRRQRPGRDILPQMGVFALLVLGLVAVSLAMSDAPLSSRLAYSRSFVGPIALIVLGYASRVRTRDILVYLSASLVLSVGLGAIYYAIGHATAWTWASAYFQFRHGGYSPSLGYPGIWSTVFFDFRFLRFGGGYLDPIALGYAAAAASILSLRHAWWAGVLTFSLVALITASKGAWLVLGLGVLLYLYFSGRGLTLRALSVLGLAGLVAALPLVADQGKGSFRVHLEGLRAGLTATADKPLGHGLGVGGNWGSILGTGSTDTTTGSESAIGAIGYQLGIPGLALTLIGLVSMALAFVRGVRGAALNGEAPLGLALLLPTIALLLFQENSISVSAAFPLWVAIGAALASTHRRTAHAEAASMPRHHV